MNEGDLLIRARDFLGAFGHGRLVDQMLDFCDSKLFKLCVVGGFSRGKSHFINLLLGKSILPESAVPTTGHRTEIHYGPEEKLEIISSGKVETARLSPETLDRFSLYNDPEKEIVLRIYLPLPVLENGLVIIDTPGVEDAFGDADSIAIKALEEADAAIVMASAMAPFSLTECAFINEYMVDRKLPLIAAGISYGDKIPDEERKRQLEFIIKRCHEFYPDMKILVPECFGVSAPDLICGERGIKSFISGWQRLPELAVLKKNAVLSRLRDAIDAQLASFMARREILAGDVEENRRKIAEAIGNLEDGSDAAMDLRLRFVDNVETLKDQIRRELRQFCDGIIRNADSLSEEMIMKEAFGLHERLTSEAKTRLQQAVSSLARNLEQQCGIPAQLANMPEIGFKPLVLTRINLGSGPQTKWLDDLFQKGLNIGDMYAGRLPGGVMVWTVIKPHLRTLYMKGKDGLLGDSAARAALKKEINAICSSMGRQITEGMQRIYQDVFTNMKNARLQWLEQRRKELAKNAGMEQARKNLAGIEAKLAAGEAIVKDIDNRLGEIQ